MTGTRTVTPSEPCTPLHSQLASKTNFSPGLPHMAECGHDGTPGLASG